MAGESLLVILLVGLIAGWLAGHFVRGTGFGLLPDIAIGIVGALIGNWLFPQLGIHLATGMISSVFTATVGAILLLVVLRLFRRRRRWL
jgi:LPXTG-motif cell wall-anchored protein